MMIRIIETIPHGFMTMKIKAGIFMLFITGAFALTPPPAVSVGSMSIKDYRIETTCLYTADNKLARIAIRTFSMNGKRNYVAVNPVTMETELVPAEKYHILGKTLGETRAEYGRLVYFKTIAMAEANARRLQNAGITHIPVSDRSVFVTADLCPTKLGMDRVLFSRIISEYGRIHKPVPVALAVSGVWIEKHRDDLAWLMGLIKRKELAVIWVNHTYHHRYNRRIPWWRNFLLDKKYRVTDEILRNEMTMIEAGLVPSVFFRFPGLVSNKEIFTQVTDCGLIPLGSDAWLGKKQWPVFGSIILVHANGQEPVGIKRMLWLLESKKSEIEAGKWVISDLRDGLRRSMKMN
jgi:hypothetical protein